MLERCPGCRVRLAAEPTCPRCGCDLALVRRVEARAGQLNARAVQAWARGDRERARECASAALALERSALARSVLKCLGPSDDVLVL